MFLGGDPSYVQKDKQLIQALGLNFKFVSVGAEPAQVARWSQLYKQHKPVHLLLVHPAVPEHGRTSSSEVKLPPRFKGCQDDAKAGGDVKQYECAYRQLRDREGVQQEVRHERLARRTPVLKRFKWSNEDQEIVAKWIAGRPHEPGQGRAEVGRGEQGEGQQVAR